MSQKRTINAGTKILFIVAITVAIVTGILLFFLSPGGKEEPIALQNTYKVNCGSCHILPDPENIPTYIWKSRVLPEMAERMGYKPNSKSPQYSDEENYYIELNEAYPEKPLIDSVKWQRIHDYILNMAPDNISNSPTRKGRSGRLTQFNSSLRVLDKTQPTDGIVNITFDTITNQLLIGDYYGHLYEWENLEIKSTLNSPIVTSFTDDNSLYLTEIGIMNPSEIPKGAIYKVESDSTTPLYKKLHRPVYSKINDVNEDGEKELIICEFGHLTGELSMLVKKGATFEKRTLLALPGSTKVEVVDMDHDGKKDIVALFGQGREGIYIFYQKKNLEFSVDQVITMGPEYGSSWFSLLDYNNDGHLDILLSNGDNADYSRFLKPYHGIRLFLNNAENKFKEKWFFPINGATRVLAEDFDLDGDFDFAVLSFFPDFTHCPEEGFVYLENKDAANYIFVPHTTQDAKSGNWLVMDKGDFDQDGDTDIMLGNFNKFPANRFKSEEGYDLLYLENTAIKKQ